MGVCVCKRCLEQAAHVFCVHIKYILIHWCTLRSKAQEYTMKSKLNHIKHHWHCVKCFKKKDITYSGMHLFFFVTSSKRPKKIDYHFFLIRQFEWKIKYYPCLPFTQMYILLLFFSNTIFASMWSLNHIEIITRKFITISNKHK